jgi:coenzyme Q-binding protein COQ10
MAQIAPARQGVHPVWSTRPGTGAGGAGGRADMPQYTERCQLPYTPEQLFDLVADVEKYPEFIPSVTAVHVRRREGDKVWLDMAVAVGALGKRFSSVATLERPRRIEIRSEDALFDRYEQRWTFDRRPDGTKVTFDVDFEFRSRLLQLIMGALLRDAARSMVRAFTGRAGRIYGAS